MEIYVDTEFIDTGVIIHPISIALVREDGKEYYGINQNQSVLLMAARDPWLRENVLSSMPLAQPIDPFHPVWDESHPDFINVKNRTRIAIDVNNFIQDTLAPSLWAWYSSYDMVVLAQLFGKFMHIPHGVPMRMNDVAQEAERLRVYVPSMPGLDKHNALSDAREVKYRREWLKNYEEGRS